MNVFEIGAKIKLDTTEYLKSLGSASKETNTFGSSIKGAFTASMKVGAAAIGAVVTETVALSSALVKGVGDLAVYGDHIDKQSQKMNMSAQAYQEWDAIMQHSGTSIDSMTMAMKTLATAVEGDGEAFELLGMNLDEVRQLSSEELFSRTITALQNVESDTQRTYIASKLLGRGATELGALLNTSAEDTEKMRQRVHELGGVMSDEAVKNAAKYQDSLQDMKTAMAGVARGITTDFLPAFTEVMDGLTAIFAGEEGGAEMVSKAVDDILSNVSSSLGKLKPIIGKIGGIIAQTVKENAPKLIKEGTKLLGDIITATIKSLPDILATAGDALNGIGEVVLGYLPDWLSDDIKSMFSSIGDMVDNINFDRLKESFNGLAESFEPIAEKLSGGIAWAFDNVVKPFGEWLMNEALPTGIDALSNAFEVLDGVLEFLEVPAKAVWEEFLQPLATNAGDFAVGSLDLLGKALGGIADEIEGVDWEGFWLDIENFGDNWKTGAQGIADFLDDNFDTIKEFFSESEFGEGWFNFWSKTGEIIETSVTGWISFFKETINWINDFKDAWVTGFDAICDAVDKLADKLSAHWDFWEGFGGYLADKFNPTIDSNAEGGYITTPRLSWVAEKEPEYIIPESKMDKVFKNGGSGYTFNFYYQGGSGMTDAEIEEQAKRLAELSIAQIRAVGGTGF